MLPGRASVEPLQKFSPRDLPPRFYEGDVEWRQDPGSTIQEWMSALFAAATTTASGEDSGFHLHKPNEGTTLPVVQRFSH